MAVLNGSREYEVLKSTVNGTSLYGINTGSCGPCHNGLRGFDEFIQALFEFRERYPNIEHRYKPSSLLPPEIEKLSNYELRIVSLILEERRPIEDILKEMEKQEKRGETIANWLERVFPGIDGKIMEGYLGRINEEISRLKKLEGGCSSNAVIDLGGTIIKIDKLGGATPGLTGADLEYTILSLDLGKFQYAPKPLSAPEHIDGFGLWTMNDVTKEIPAFVKSGIFDPMDHYMDVIGLFHYHATIAVKEKGIVLPVGHFQYGGFGYIEGIGAMYKLLGHHLNGEKRILRELSSPLADTLKYVAENADTVIHGDFKIGVNNKNNDILDFGSNVENGYIVDFHRVRWGKIAEDLARAFVSADLNHGQIMHYTGRYIEHRSKYDEEFRQDLKKQQEIYALMPHLVRKERLRFATTLRMRVGIKPSEIIIASADQLLHGAYENFSKDKKGLLKLVA